MTTVTNSLHTPANTTIFHSEFTDAWMLQKYVQVGNIIFYQMDWDTNEDLP